MASSGKQGGGSADSTAGGYSWASIALHWTSAIAVLALLFTGDSISVSGASVMGIHTTIGVCAWALLAGRVGWRLWRRHPDPSPSQGRRSFMAGLVVHYLLLAGIGLMLVSGPLAGWASGRGLDVFAVNLPGAATPFPEIHEAARSAHHLGAWLIGLGTLAHIAGVLKHVMIDRDDTFERIMVVGSNLRNRTGK